MRYRPLGLTSSARVRPYVAGHFLPSLGMTVQPTGFVTSVECYVLWCRVHRGHVDRRVAGWRVTRRTEGQCSRRFRMIMALVGVVRILEILPMRSHGFVWTAHPHRYRGNLRWGVSGRQPTWRGGDVASRRGPPHMTVPMGFRLGREEPTRRIFPDPFGFQIP